MLDFFSFLTVAVYDPEEACKEDENEDEKMEAKDDVKTENAEETSDNFQNETQEEVKAEVKEEAQVVQPEAELKSPRRRGAVRNGAGPKSKTRGKK